MASTDTNMWREHVPIVQAGNPVFSPPLRGLMVLAAGQVAFVTEHGETVTKSLEAGTLIPFYIRQILDAETTVADGSLMAGR